tara:strand:- start:8588 stop:9154 length:567 start_codon:yes stop_codon:yes gene_type:complete
MELFIIGITAGVLTFSAAIFLMLRKFRKEEDLDPISRIANKLEDVHVFRCDKKCGGFCGLEEKKLPRFGLGVNPTQAYEYADPVEPIILETPGGRKIPRIKLANGKICHRALRHVGQDRDGTIITETLVPLDNTSKAIKHVLTEKVVEEDREKRNEERKQRAKERAGWVTKLSHPKKPEKADEKPPSA